ncbi:arsenite efflux transporter metallochaperone ArsD [Halalkalicoccus subterraneus]|uniref:arsenite efflux transporter metallochaperone ArsD n=1 Tax=Halalkalicoccus subterraneus TaxID=2675002 RepID=UPI000EFB1E6A|nr:arsenite efflux transporter metallochaperone ArsD [Halalkalicoccus subterraneus]
MTEITIFEEAMCCSTGVCGPDPDKELVSFTHTVDRIEEEFADVEVSRANLSGGIERFLDHETVYDAVESEGPSVLPITTVDDEIVAREEYPSYDRLASLVEERQPQEAH